jgi:hypothetical protein
MLVLLDLDGTLINDRGYRAAIDATVLHYAASHALPVFAPSDEDVHLLHAHGYSNEWDSVAFMAGILHHAAWYGQSTRPDFQAWVRQTNGLPGLPNERACAVLLQHSPAPLHATIHALLDNVTDVENTPTTRLFAEMILGSHMFNEHYGLMPDLNVPSLLETLDEPLINAASRETILAHRSCIFTARPSLPPGHRHPASAGDEVGAAVHPPEAEIGLKLLRLEHLPMIALGHVQWLADKYNERVYDLTKPAPVQALAAMLTASGTSEQTALRYAFDLWKSGEFNPEYQRLSDEHVYVFEDNAAGVKACHTAAMLLSVHGVKVTIHGMGIATAEAKRQALEPYCDHVFNYTNDALAMLAGATH